MKRANLCLLGVGAFFLGSSSVCRALAQSVPVTCLTDPKIQAARSEELKKLYDGDQQDRQELEAHMDKIWPKDKVEMMVKNDNERRRRVAEIFAEGCMKSAADYANAAMVYQHGIVPDHFYQTFIWSKKAVELGDAKQKHLMALGLDRYLMNSGQKQLFGSQAKKLKSGDLCWCLAPIEASFPESLRSEYLGQTKEEKFQWLKQINGHNPCPVAECNMDLKPTPRGAVPGFW